ncbi:unnamed protein product [Protopolystoma xenopodis]|uniref:Uncharacterized protein n=1 Tax=Protopolystoma xenopodis TaxID=117903 RepID=A0A3S5B5S7_9PLAT|nr:unnamed protein product [Protopolystoma xenopodis]
MEVSQLAFNPRLAGAIPISNIGSTSHGGPFDLAPGSLTVVVSEETDSATLGRVKLGLAAAMFFTVLVACCLPILLLFCLQRKTTRRKGLGHSRPSEALREKPSDSESISGRAGLQCDLSFDVWTKE